MSRWRRYHRSHGGRREAVQCGLDKLPYLFLKRLVIVTVLPLDEPVPRMRIWLAAAAATVVLGTTAAVALAAPAPFRHPGVLDSRASLDLVRGKVNSGAQPWKAAFERMRRDPLASLARRAKPRATVECGSGSNPNLGCTDERTDANAAYTQALLWYLTRDARYAAKAIELMDAWSAVLRNHTNSNAPLQSGWAGTNWSRAGELIKHTYSGKWAQEARFARMLRTVYLPVVIKGSGANGNWELIMLDAAVGISVYLDDRASFDKAVKLWRGRVPAYFYLKSDGPTPKSPPGYPKSGAALVRYWYGQKNPVEGQAQETCRDLGHTGWGLSAAVHVAETARIQGLDLYAEQQTRLTKAMEFLTGLATAVPGNVCGGKVSGGLGPVLEVGYNQFHHRKGIALPHTQKAVERARPAGTSHFLAWETLTHANCP
jgi:hypothetical protein